MERRARHEPACRRRAPAGRGQVRRPQARASPRRSIGLARRGPPWTQRRAETITGCWAVVNEGLCVRALPPHLPSGFSRPACGQWQTCSPSPLRGTRRADHCSMTAPAAFGREGGREGEFVAKSRKGQSAGTAGPKSAAKDASKELARLEKRLQKARDVEAKRKKQASEARAEVVQLTAQIKELRPPARARSATAPASSRAASSARAKPAAAKPVAAKPAAARSTAAKAAAPKPKVAVSSTGATATARRSTTSTTGRKTASSPATRTPRTRKAAPDDGSGDGTGPT